MKPCNIFLFLIIIFSACETNNDKKLPVEIKNFYWGFKDTSIIELYRTIPKQSALILFKKTKTYLYETGSCQGVYKDSGNYIIKNDTIVIKSTINPKKDTSWMKDDYYANIDKQNKFHLKEGRIQLIYKEHIDTSFTFFRVGFSDGINSYLDKYGDGYLLLLDIETGDNKELGYYKNSELYNGERLMNKNKMQIDTFRNGKKIN